MKSIGIQVTGTLIAAVANIVGAVKIKPMISLYDAAEPNDMVPIGGFQRKSSLSYSNIPHY